MGDEHKGNDDAALQGNYGQESLFVLTIAAVYGVCLSNIRMGYDEGRVLYIDGPGVHSSGDDSHIVTIRNYTCFGCPCNAGEAAGASTLPKTLDILRFDPKII